MNDNVHVLALLDTDVRRRLLSFGATNSPPSLKKRTDFSNSFVSSRERKM
jgi:hypothetical protein